MLAFLPTVALGRTHGHEQPFVATFAPPNAAFRMSLRLKFILFVAVLHGIIAALAVQLRTVNVPLFVGSEVLLLGSLVWAVQLYRDFVRPLQLIVAGTEAMQAQDFSLKFLPVGQHEMDQLIIVYNQMLNALRRERVSQHEKSFLLERLIQASPAGILLLDFEGRIESLNPAAERFLDQPAAAVTGLLPAGLPGEWGAALADLAENQPQVLRFSGLATYRAHAAHFLDRGFARRFLLLEELTQELIQQEKVAYGQLIRMMSHEINNSIGAINSILHSFAHYTPQLAPADRPDYAEALAVSIARNTHLANFIAGFSRLVRLPPPAPAPTDLNALLRGIARLLQPQSDARRIAWHFALTPDPFVLSLDPQQLEQALLNIAKNALEAIGEGGNVWVSTTAGPPTLVIENDGPPLLPAVSQQLFTPFFSTKKDGQGIGLTLVRDILLQHRCTFRLAANAAGRTAFTIRF